MVSYQDLLDSHYSLKDFSRFCGCSVASVKMWKNRGIPKKYQSILSVKILVKNNSLFGKRVIKSAKNVTTPKELKRGSFPLRISNLEIEKKINVTLVKDCKNSGLFGSSKKPLFFAKIAPFQPELILTSDKTFLSESEGKKLFVDDQGVIFEFKKKRSGKLSYIPSHDELICDRFHLQSLTLKLHLHHVFWLFQREVLRVFFQGLSLSQ